MTDLTETETASGAIPDGLTRPHVRSIFGPREDLDTQQTSAHPSILGHDYEPVPLSADNLMDFAQTGKVAENEDPRHEPADNMPEQEFPANDDLDALFGDNLMEVTWTGKGVEDEKSRHEPADIPLHSLNTLSADRFPSLADPIGLEDFALTKKVTERKPQPKLADVSLDSLSTPNADNFPSLADPIAFEDFELPKRQLRPQRREIQTTWLDTDNTGNYDPIEEERKARVKRIRTKAPAFRPATERAVDCVEDVEHQETALLVVLKFTTRKNKFLDKLSQWAAEEQAEQSGRRLRSSNRVLSPHGCVDMTVAVDAIDMTGKPWARGCQKCASPGVAEICSLLHDETTWPCQHCQEEETDCELIVPPVRKQPCKLCKKRRLPCSYANTRNHGASCQQCDAVRMPCVAGPLKEYVRQRIRYPEEGEPLAPPKKKSNGKQKAQEDCVECRKSGVACRPPLDSNGGPLTDNYGGPCASCKDGKLPCTITEGKGLTIAPFDKRSQVVPHAQASASPKNYLSATLPLSQRQQSSQPVVVPASRPFASSCKQPPVKFQSRMRSIYTSYSHPIIFNCNDENIGNNMPCHFCTDPELMIFGYGRVKVHVIDYPDGRGFIEISGGHKERDTESTRLCMSCTAQRLLMRDCASHKIRAIPVIRLRSPSNDETDEDLGNGKGLERFCDLCQNLALYRCEAAQDHDGRGCGLQLCEPCARSLVVTYRGNFGEMLKSLRGWQQKLRADMEFLEADGALARHLKWISRQQ